MCETLILHWKVTEKIMKQKFNGGFFWLRDAIKKNYLSSETIPKYGMGGRGVVVNIFSS